MVIVGIGMLALVMLAYAGSLTLPRKVLTRNKKRKASPPSSSLLSMATSSVASARTGWDW